MAFYHLTPHQALGLLTKTFWAMSANIDRIQAQRDMRHLTTAICSQSQEAAQQHRQRLELELGEIVEADHSAPPPTRQRDPRNDRRDRAGFEELRAMAAQSLYSPVIKK